MKTTKKLPRGIRNNNPLNIVRNNMRWKGLCKEQTDPQFFQFESIVMGIRAACLILRTYDRKYGINTIRDIVARWCPDNTAVAYMNTVAQLLQCHIDDTVHWSDKESTVRLLCAMSIIECGCELNPDLFRKGWVKAFGV